MKLFFASDLHGSLPATLKAIALFESSGADHFILLGDILNHGPRNPIPEGYDPAAVAEALNHYADKILAVRGNCDSEVDQMLLHFPLMSDFAWVLLESGKRLFLTHGHKYNLRQRPPLRHDDALVHGHTHIPVARRQEDIVVFNPGSLTFPRDGYAPSYGVMEQGILSVLDLNGGIIEQVTL